jgi:hypothetical protein
MGLREAAFTMIALVGLGVQADAQTSCAELLRLRNAANQPWKRAMRVPRSERCLALHHATLAAEATLKYVNDNRRSCNIAIRTKWNRTTARRYRLTTMFVLDARFDPFHQTSSNEIRRSLDSDRAFRQLMSGLPSRDSQLWPRSALPLTATGRSIWGKRGQRKQAVNQTNYEDCRLFSALVRCR